MLNNDILNSIEDALKRTMESKRFVYPPRLYEAMSYSVFSDGKRIRPYLMFLSAEFFGVSQKSIMPFAVALEFIHTYSLIHDDLPCMDNDDYRRGKLTSHKMFGEAIALLAGDALLNLAYEIIFTAVQQDNNLIHSAEFVAKCAGADGMIGGQAMEFSIDSFDETLITELYMKKTGALIRAAALVPAFINLDREKFAAIGTYANAVGLNFQLCDDLLDEDKQEKNNYLNIMGRDFTCNMSEKLNAIAIKSIVKWPEAQSLIEFSEFLTHRKK